MNMLNDFLKVMGEVSVTGIKELSAEVSIEQPYMFILRTKEKNVKVFKEDEKRIIFTRNDKHKTRIAAVPIDEITEVKIKWYAENIQDVLFSIRDLTYHLIIVR